MNSFAAVDLGASSGRVMVARVAADSLALTEAHRFPNRPVRTGGRLHWDVLGLYAGVLDGLRAAVYGVEEEKLGEFYAQRTLLKREVLPDHVADAVFALTGGDLTRTTGLHVPVDSGVAAAFLR